MRARWKVQFLLLIYISIILYGYNFFISNTAFLHWKYDESVLVGLSFIALLPSFWMPIHSFKPSSLVYWVLYLVVYIPATLIPYLSIRIAIDELIFFNISFFLSFIICLRLHFSNLIRFKYVHMRVEVFYIAFFSLYLVFTLLLIRNFGFNLSFVSLKDVYDVREAFSERLEGESTSYIRWLLYVLNPFLIVMGFLSKGRKWMLALGLIGEFFIYSTSGLKSSLFIGPAILLVLFLMQRFNIAHKLGPIILTAMCILLPLSMVADSIFFRDANKSQNVITSLTLRRNIVLPGYLTGEYYKFFSKNPKAFMAKNKYFGILVGYQTVYEEASTPRIIGKRLYGDEAVNANANIWADAYANYGVIGMFVTSLLLGLFLKLYDSFANGIEPKLSFIMLTGPAFFFSNSALLTAFVGHGAIVALLLIYFYKSLLLTKHIKQGN